MEISQTYKNEVDAVFEFYTNKHPVCAVRVFLQIFVPVLFLFCQYLFLWGDGYFFRFSPRGR
jgi:hypothetical protein